jgi:bacillopeptidase F
VVVAPCPGGTSASGARASRRCAGTAFLLAFLAIALPAPGGAIDPRLLALARESPKADVDVVVTLADTVPVDSFTDPDKRSRQAALIVALRDKAARTQGDVIAQLSARGGRDLRVLWLINAVAARIGAAAATDVASLPGVDEVRLDEVLQAPEQISGISAPLEWNLQAIRVRDVWEEGLTGRGVIVGSLDTGVDATHPDLAPSWRGGSNSWYDPYGQHPTPFDRSGHGTQTLGVIVGGAAGGSAIGVAPGSRWIAGKVFNDAGQGLASRIHLAFQWLLDPDGQSQTPDAADVVNASWGYGPSGACVTEFEPDIKVLRAAGIPVVFAAGNSGPSPGSSLSPANNPGAVSVGAVNQAATVATFSSRGPSACTGATFPTLVAPGVDVRTADLSFGGFPFFTTISGTSLAAPHVTGVMALLLGASPNATVEALESAVSRSARDLGLVGVDDDSGHGLLDAEGALRVLVGKGGLPPVFTSIPVTTTTLLERYTYRVVAIDPDGGKVRLSLDLGPAGMVLGRSRSLTWTPDEKQLGDNPVRLRATGASGLTAIQSFTITVIGHTERGE